MCDSGFTLIELLVALVVFSMGALALVQLDSATVRTGRAIAERQLARIELDNLVAETITDPRAPAFGKSNGQTQNVGRTWRWLRNAEPLEGSLVRIDLAVAGEDGQVLASQTLVRERE